MSYAYALLVQKVSVCYGLQGGEGDCFYVVGNGEFEVLATQVPTICFTFVIHVKINPRNSLSITETFCSSQCRKIKIERFQECCRSTQLTSYHPLGSLH